MHRLKNYDRTLLGLQELGVFLIKFSLEATRSTLFQLVSVTHGDTRLNISWSTNVAAVVQQMSNCVSCDVDFWNMPFNALNVVERKSRPALFRSTCLSETLFKVLLLQDLELCVIGLRLQVIKTAAERLIFINATKCPVKYKHHLCNCSLLS